MKIILPGPTQRTEFAKAFDQIESWEYALTPSDLSNNESLFWYDFWLGSSRDGQTWALATTYYLDEDDHDDDYSVVVILLNPPKRNADTIAEILIRVYVAAIDDQFDEKVIDQILDTVSFPEYRLVGSYLPEAPKEWHHLPAELVVSFGLSEGGGVNSSTFEVFSRDSLDDAIRMVCGPRYGGILIHYTLATREVVPFLQWDVDWPLVRQGKRAPIRRSKVQGVLPWEYEVDQTLVSIYQYLPNTGRGQAPPFFGQPVVRLRVGGQTRDAAIANWHVCARSLRAMKSLLERGCSLESVPTCEEVSNA